MKLFRPHALALLAALTLASATPAAADLAMEIGPTVGFGYSNLKVDATSSLEGRSSFDFGGVLDLGISERLGVRFEPMFVSKGAKFTHRNDYYATMDGVVFNLDYLDIPIMARYDLAATEARGFLLGGVGIGFATKREAELTQGQQHTTVDFADVFSSTDFTLDLGAGVSFPSGGNRLTIDGWASIGLTDINNGGTVSVNGAPFTVPGNATHTLAFRLMGTYLFKL